MAMLRPITLLWRGPVTTMSQDPRVIINEAPMSRAQWGIVAVMVGLNALDGFDVLSISFASPGIAKDWGIDRAALGFVLSMELIGMAIGSLFLGGLADKVGRRNTILGCLGLMTAGMLGAATAHDVRDAVGLASADRARHRRNACGDQCRGGGSREQPASLAGGGADGGGLSGRHDHRRVDLGRAAGALRLARGVRVRRLLQRHVHSAGPVARA